MAIGEIGLAGELRRVRDLPQRLAEAARLGFKVAVVPGRAAAGARGAPSPDASTACGSSTSPDVARALRLLDLDSRTRHASTVDDRGQARVP